jgi:hypothetical protein
MGKGVREREKRCQMKEKMEKGNGKGMPRSSGCLFLFVSSSPVLLVVGVDGDAFC